MLRSQVTILKREGYDATLDQRGFGCTGSMASLVGVQIYLTQMDFLFIYDEI